VSDLNAFERRYLFELIKEHLDYYRLLAGTPKCSAKHKSQHIQLETLTTKLARGHEPKPNAVNLSQSK
jgi:hypothetical protein